MSNKVANKSLIITLLLVSSFVLQAQKVGLVLSGGAAKGIAHIGVMKALEENDIPIDYVVGTSMGAVVGSLYAAGFSPEEIEAIVTNLTSKTGSMEYLQNAINTTILNRKTMLHG